MSKFGKFFFTIVVLGLLITGILNWLPKFKTSSDLSPDSTDQGAGTSTEGNANALSEFEFVAVSPEPPRLPPPGTYEMKDNTLVIELSEYAGYAGLIIANQGLEPNEDSFFFKNYGFKVHLTTSEADSWPALQRGEMAGSSTTVDVLACYGRQFSAVVPAQICYSRGADGIIVRKEIKRINDLKGKVIVCAPYNETEFFIRYLAREANLEIQRLDDISDTPAADKVNLLYCEDAMVAGEAFQADLDAGGNKIAGCVTWAPKTTELVEANKGKVRQLVDNRNLLIISDILMFNKGFAEANPDKVQAVVHGLLDGNARVRENPAAYAKALADAFKAFEWTEEDALAELSKVHLSNLPENLAFFSSAIDAAGSFSSLYQSANLAYGSKIIRNPVAADKFMNTAALEGLKTKGLFASQEIAIKPIRSTNTSPIENDPLLSKDIRFLFQPNSADLDSDKAVNTEYLAKINELLQISPGSLILLRGHVDDAMVDEFRKKGGNALVNKMALNAMELSKNRADEVRKHLINTLKIDAARIEVIGRGWEEPLGSDSDENRRVEVQWFTIE